jgi:hypothetical protein
MTWVTPMGPTRARRDPLNAMMDSKELLNRGCEE